jgi:predicted KAP-like P-loop ATPase
MIVDKPLGVEDFLKKSEEKERVALLLSRINRLLKSNQGGSITVSISGDWGSGKSSYLKAIQSYYRDFRGASTLFFEAWKYKDEKNILLPLIKKIKDINGISSQTKAKLQKLIKPILASSLLTSEFFLKKTLDIDIKDIKKTLKLIEESSMFLNSKYQDNLTNFKKTIEEMIKNYKSPTNDNHYLWENIDIEYSLEKAPFVLIIDDLDRLIPKEAFSVIETLRFYFDVDNVLIVMGINDKILNSHIKSYFQIDDKDSKERFLEKVFQYNYELSHSMLNNLHLRNFSDEQKETIKSVVINIQKLPHRKWIKILNRLNPQTISSDSVILAILQELYYEFELKSREFDDILGKIRTEERFKNEIIDLLKSQKCDIRTFEKLIELENI